MADVMLIEKKMLHCPSCDWAWQFEEDGIRCPFCEAAIGVAGPDAPEEAKEEIAQFNSE